jgi:POT family proton-dependent oligopeptide transporter
MILIFAPTFAYFLYPKINSLFDLTPIRKINIGLFLAVPSFIIIGWLQSQIDAGLSPSIAWQVFAYAILTASEVFVSITCLEFSYTQAPKTMKSFIMGLFLMSVALGNTFTAVVSAFIVNDDGSLMLTGADYFYFYAKLMFATSILFLLIVKYYKPKTYLHQEA